MPVVSAGGLDVGTEGQYRYMQELASLESCRPVVKEEGPKELGVSLAEVRTLLEVVEWRKALQDHPDAEFVGYLLKGISQGFRIGLNWELVQLKTAKRNMLSATEDPAVIEAYLAKERAAGIIDPLVVEGGAATSIYISCFSIIPKPHQPGKWLLIVDLLHSRGHSVNNSMDPKLCCLSYVSTDAAAAMVLSLGQGAELAKLDVASAYRIAPVHPDDWPLLGMKWRGNLYVDTALPFGLQSAPKFFTAVTNELEWIL